MRPELLDRQGNQERPTQRSRSKLAALADEAEPAKRIVEAFRTAEKSGTAAVVLDGKFIVYPVVERSKKSFALA